MPDHMKKLFEHVKATKPTILTCHIRFCFAASLKNEDDSMSSFFCKTCFFYDDLKSLGCTLDFSEKCYLLFDICNSIMASAESGGGAGDGCHECSNTNLNKLHSSIAAATAKLVRWEVSHDLRPFLHL